MYQSFVINALSYKNKRKKQKKTFQGVLEPIQTNWKLTLWLEEVVKNPNRPEANHLALFKAQARSWTRGNR